MPRVGSRIRTVGPAFPSQGPANLAATLSGTVLQPRRFGRNPVVRARLSAALRNVDPTEFVPQRPYTSTRRLELGPTSPAALAASTADPRDDCADCG